VPSTLSNRVTLVWGLLVLATGTSWLLGTDRVVGSSASTASVIIFIVSFVKVRFVGRHFMELRDAPDLFRRAFDSYCVLACVCLVGVYAWA
jgi:hypothetical protein